MNVRKEAEKLYALLQLTNRVVGVKFVYTKEEYDAVAANECVRPIAYCCAVRAATKGHSVKITKESSGCEGSNKSIGFVQPPEDFFNGNAGKRLGLYKTEEIAAKVSQTVPMMPMGTYGIVAKPLECFEQEPQIALIVCNAREMMRVIQGYTYTYGLADWLSFSGNRAVCVESTVTPILTDRINVSVMCGGTRFRAKWSDNDMIIGIPISQLSGVVDGILQTVNPMEMDERKREIERRLSMTGNLSIDVVYGKTYFKTWEKK